MLTKKYPSTTRIVGIVLRSYIPNSGGPDGPLGAEDDAKQVVEHYELDPSRGWAIHRKAFFWSGDTSGPIKLLTLTMNQSPAARLICNGGV